MRLGLSVLAALAFASAALAQQVTQQTVAGVDNFKRLETTIACAGATTPQAVPALKQMGYASIINLRMADEEGANVDQEAAAAKAAGIRFIHIPFNGQKPDPAAADQFVKAVTAPENQPAFVHCHSGNRAAAMWMIKRLVVDKWDEDRAFTEATALGLSNAGLRKFATDYAETHRQ
jgi:uncharacterized protein (TIGR01244 family)